MKRAISEGQAEFNDTTTGNSSTSGSSKEMSPLKKALSNPINTNQEEVSSDNIQHFQKNAIWLRMQKYKRDFEIYKTVVEQLIPTVKAFSSLFSMQQSTDLFAEFEKFLQEKQRTDLLMLLSQPVVGKGEGSEKSSTDQQLLKDALLAYQRQSVQAKLSQELQSKYDLLARKMDKEMISKPAETIAPTTVSQVRQQSVCSNDTLEILALTNETLEKRTAELQQLQIAYNSSLVEVEELKLQQAEVKEDENFEYLNLVKNLNFQSSTLRDRIDSYERELVQLNKDLDDCYAKRKLYIQDCERGFVEKEQRLVSIISQLESEVTRVKNDRDCARQFMEGTRSKNDSLKSANLDLQQKIDKLEVVYESLCKENSFYKKKLAILGIEEGEEGESQLKSIGLSDSLLQAIRTEQDYAQELESVAKAFDDLSKLNSKLSTKLGTKEEQISNLIEEKSKLEMAYSSLYKEKESLLAKVNQEISLLKDQLLQSDTKSKHLNNQLITLEKELSQNQSSTEQGKRKIAELVGQLNDLSYKYEQIRQKHDTFIKSFPLNFAELTQLRGDTKRLEGELVIYRKKVSSLQSGNTKEIAKEVMEELDVCKKLLYCSSCNLRQKEVALNKCMHVFCKECIDNRLETRQRKCPMCLEPFGANDVRNIYL